MTGHPTIEELEAVALGEGESAGARAHVEGCSECAREIAWLRAETELLRRRPQPSLNPELWQRIDERVHAPIPITRARRWRTVAGAAVAVAAAAALAIVVRPQRPATPGGSDASVADEESYEVDAKAQQALDRAAGDYRTALEVLQREYAQRRGRLDPRTQKRWDESFARAKLLIDSSAQARNDLDERVKLLDGTALMVRSLRYAVEDSEEAR
jgi:hypothetical protein